MVLSILCMMCIFNDFDDVARRMRQAFHLNKFRSLIVCNWYIRAIDNRYESVGEILSVSFNDTAVNLFF